MSYLFLSFFFASQRSTWPCSLKNKLSRLESWIQIVFQRISKLHCCHWSAMKCCLIFISFQKNEPTVTSMSELCEWPNVLFAESSQDAEASTYLFLMKTINSTFHRSALAHDNNRNVSNSSLFLGMIGPIAEIRSVSNCKNVFYSVTDFFSPVILMTA